MADKNILLVKNNPQSSRLRKYTDIRMPKKRRIQQAAFCTAFHLTVGYAENRI